MYIVPYSHRGAGGFFKVIWEDFHVGKMGKEEGDGIQNTHENVRTTKFYKLLHLKLEMSLHACLLVIRAEKSFQKG